VSSRRDQKKRKRTRERTSKPAVKAVSAEELKDVIARARELGLPEEDCANLEAAIETLQFVVGQLDSKTLTLARLRSLFGLATSEKTKTVVGDQKKPEQPGSAGDRGAGASGDTAGAKPSETDSDSEREAAPGHGRNGFEDYPGAETLEVSHESLASGATCPDCQQGKVYEQKHRPRVLLRVEGQPPLKATVVKLQALRCNLCGRVHTAERPAGVGEEKYGETAAAMIGLLKYGAGLPFNRLEWLERNLGIPLPASTQWEVVRDAADELAPVHEELIRQAAQAEIFHNDDTSARVLSLMAENRAVAASGEADAGARTGIFATSIVAILGDERRVALFFTGRKHAGENAQDLLEQRAAELGPPIQMCDALDRNVPAKAETLLGNCLAHGRRKFVETYESFPAACRHVLETLGEVFGHEAHVKDAGLSPEQRLRHHRQHSAPLLDGLHAWMERQLDDRLVEPNSTLGDALRYMLNHWEPLTLFLRLPGAPLDNNICERALKKFILLRKNAYFYKTVNGAAVGDCFMSLIHTAELNQVNPFDYLVELLRHASEIDENPSAWLPWNYRSNRRD
jgi:transposase